MQKVYTNQNIAMVGAMRSYLEENDIAVQIRNEFSSSVMGEVPFLEVWPELWVGDHAYLQAETLLAEMQGSSVSDRDWSCASCKEANPASFEVCWQCGRAGAA